ncbi:MAG: hypothetical protein K6B41_04020 [Butyrivibrio sp.]|nr:hypothetical protein [Butyrivibrio sp.]
MTLYELLTTKGVTKNDILLYLANEKPSYPEKKPVNRCSSEMHDDEEYVMPKVDQGKMLEEEMEETERLNMEYLDDLDEMQRQEDERRAYENGLNDIHDRYPHFDMDMARYEHPNLEAAERQARMDDYLMNW